MSFVDLASSECLKTLSKHNSTRARDGAKINLSHLALESCLRALSTNGAHRVPYRGSQLTRILKDSLGGTCQTLIIATISPSKRSLAETHNTLKRAQNAMKIQVQGKKNLTVFPLTMSMYPAVISELKQNLAAAQRKLRANTRAKIAAQAETFQALQDCWAMQAELKAVAAKQDAMEKEVRRLEEFLQAADTKEPM